MGLGLAAFITLALGFAFITFARFITNFPCFMAFIDRFIGTTCPCIADP